MRILLVFLNFDCPVGLSHGLAVLGRELREAGHQVDLLHVSDVLGLPFDPMLITDRIAAHHPDVVGLSFGTNHAWAAKVLVERLESALPDSFVVIGGIHATIQPDEVISWSGVDAVALGEMDGGRFVALVEDLQQGSLDRSRPGFWFRNGDAVQKNPMAPPVDLGSGSHGMDLTLFDHARIIQAKRGYADAISGRGCPFHCTYCHNDPIRKVIRRTWGPFPSVRKRPVAEVIAELMEYHDRYGRWIRVFSFTDDVFPGPGDWTAQFLDAYGQAFDLPLVFCAAPPQVTEDLASAASRAGTYMVRIGVESGSERIRRKVLGRPFGDDLLVRSVRNLHAHGVNALTFFMMAMPGETESDLFETFRCAARLRPDAVQLSVFWPYPGTKLHDQAVEEGLFDPQDQYRGNYLTDSPLSWPERQSRLYRRIRKLASCAINAKLHPKADFGAILDAALAIPDSEWDQGGMLELAARVDRHQRDILSTGAFVYVAPFADRPDVLLLAGRGRTRPLVNLPEDYVSP